MPLSLLRRPIFFVCLALLAGAFLRFHLLGSVPPGLHYDFAANAILAEDIAFGNFRDVFITAYTGKETLFFYTAGLLFKTIGSSIFTLQLTAAFYGILGIAACYFAARQLTWAEPESVWIAALAVVILSFTFMHLVWSRYGERAVTEPFIQGLAIGFLLRGLRLSQRAFENRSKPVLRLAQDKLAGGPTARTRLESIFHFSFRSTNPLVNMILAGAFTGLAAYTYLAARLFPVPIAITLIVFFIQTKLAGKRSRTAHPPDPPTTRLSDYPTTRPPDHSTTRLPDYPTTGLLFYLAAAFLIFAPLGWFFIQHPDSFLTRASQLTPQPGESDLLFKGITGALGMIFISGEPYDRFNLPGRPIFGPLLGFFFVIGLVYMIARLFSLARITHLVFRISHTISRVMNYLFGLRITPSGYELRDTQLAISNQQFPIAYLFTLLYTLTFLVPTAIAVHDIFPSNVRAMGLLPVLTIFPALGIVKVSKLLSMISNQYRRYRSLITDYWLLITLTLLAGTLTTYSAYFYLWAAAPGLHYANDTDLVNAARWINTQDTQNASVYFSAIHYRHPTVAYLADDFSSFRWFTGGQALAFPPGPAIYVFPHAAPLPEDWIANWSPTSAPSGPDGAPDFRAYRFTSPPPLPDLLPASGNFGNIVELVGYRLPEPGVVDVCLRVLNLPSQSDYRFVADLIDAAGYHWTQAFNDSYFSEQWQVGEMILLRLKFQLEAGTPPGDYRLLTTIYSASANTTLPALTPEGYSAAYAAIGPIPIPRSVPQPPRNPLATLSRLNLIRFDPPPVALRPGEQLPFTLYWQSPSAYSITDYGLRITTKLNDFSIESTLPVHGAYPPSQWQPGEIVIDRHAPRLPRDLAPGVYNVTVNDFSIGRITVAALDRQFTPPAPAQSLIANYQSLFELIGYDLAPDSLTLYWHALAETDVNYTRFVHVFDAQGQLIAQNDSQLRSGSYPTSLWVKGEYVVDTTRIPMAGNTIEIGWYEAETGARLKTREEDMVKIP